MAKYSLICGIICLLGLSACRPAKFADHQEEYKRLVELVEAEQKGYILWLKGSSPDEVKRLMGQLNLSAIHYSWPEATIRFVKGGGHTPKYQYVYRQSHYEASNSNSYTKKWYVDEPLADNWYERKLRAVPLEER